MKISFTVTGLTDIISRWKRFAKAESWDAVMAEAMAEAVEVARQLCPVDTGRMRDSIRAQKIGNNEWTIVVDVPYAEPNEFGWYGIPEIGDETNPKFYKGGYRPFIRPSLWIMLQKYPNYVKKYMFTK